VVLLHGLNDAHLTWWQIAPELGRDRRVFALDLPGHGLSDRPDVDYTLAWYGQIVAHWIESLGVPEVDIVGHSLGGGIALVLLRVCRSRIRRLVLAAPGGLGREISFLLRLASLPGVVERMGQPFMGFGTWLALRRLQPKLPRDHIFALGAMNAQRGTARALARTAHDLVDWRGQRHCFLLHAHEIADLPPITVLWGDRDSVLPIAHGRALAREVEGMRFEELAGCGHFLHHDNSEMFLRVVRDAIDATSWPPMRACANPAASSVLPVPPCAVSTTVSPGRRARSGPVSGRGSWESERGGIIPDSNVGAREGAPAPCVTTLKASPPWHLMHVQDGPVSGMLVGD